MPLWFHTVHGADERIDSQNSEVASPRHMLHKREGGQVT